MSHGVGPLYLTAARDPGVISGGGSGGGRGSAFSSAFTSPTGGGTTPSENTSSGSGLGIAGGVGTDTGISVGSTNIGVDSVEQSYPKIYWNYLDTDWAENTQMTVAVFTTPSASVGGRSLNPLSEVDEEQFVTADGAEYLEESGIREAAGLGSNLSWAVVPAEVTSRSMTFLGNETTMRSYVGYVTTSDSDIPRTVLVNLATTETGDDIAFGVTVQHRAMYSLSEDSAGAPTDGILSAMYVPDLVGTIVTSGLNVSAGDDITLILEAGVTASADLAAQALGDLSLA